MMNLVFLGLIWGISSVNALPQPQASVTLFQFEPSFSSASVLGTEWAQPIGTASGGSNTTFVLVNEITATGLVNTDGSAELITTTTTIFETVVVSASGWAESNFPTTTSAGSTQLGGGQDCHLTASTSGECVQEEVLDDGSTSTRTLTGEANTLVFAISTGTLPASQSTVTALSSNQQSTITAVSSAGSGSGTPASTTSSNAALSLRARGFNDRSGVAVSVILGGIMLGATAVFI
ncbi:hypothetical protein GYMLUDRAFT_49929 [Collybiopsis luxurians FD-317 M1]|uniref:Uncharacterized protein n=1 Tax=Collybiopsis luxurians FD-317 M1 TaxID=944289 RepID=A0A0D0BD62_9AGAR|nr:hypothetical protein GYMLUDRAFT_49929 [Collybiopsis luxurians FD-317 M1]